MPLTDFFRTNLPYGIKCNDKNEWFVFNREYSPLGWNAKAITDEDFSNLPVYTKYKGITENALIKIANDTSAIQRDEDGKIKMLFFYNDRTNPQTTPKYWNEYFEKIKLLSKFEVATNSSAIVL